ncbi:M20/M25/M40 family metallo-hydrolase [Labilibacter marinus]|uniref:M20/M25/M40 family metallo-hydrolase n=1 Tax=Labilibacter marinus TaxID=1477105 RepID=UPI0008324AA7|nr:M20/M25/M40 family metallo-hydrolase [Labilibacter marinus]
MKLLTLTLVVLIISAGLFAQEKMKGYQAITESRVKTQLEFLASDFTEGREPGTLGIEMAAQYIASMYQYVGLEPFSIDDNRPSFLQTFPLIKFGQEDKVNIEIIETSGSISLNHKVDYTCNVRSDIGFDIETELVFAGYGISDQEIGYDDLKGLNVKNKIVVILGSYPGVHDPESELAKKFLPNPKDYKPYRKIYRDRIDNLKAKGARAIFVIGEDDQEMLYSAENKKLRYRNKHMESDAPLDSYYNYQLKLVGEVDDVLPSVYISRRIGDYLLKESGKTVSEWRNLTVNTQKPVKAKIEKRVAFSYSSQSNVIQSSNVLGMIKGEIEDEYVVVGGHYDHLGKYNGQIFNGADDNASGTVGVMMLAKAFKESGVKPKRTMVFAAWTAEEKGLLGSSYFVESMDSSQIKYYLNFDMISRNGKKDSLKNKAHFIYTSGYNRLEKTIANSVKENDVQLDITFRPKEKPTGGSDFAPFAKKGIPIGYFFAGWHDEYHQPQDEVSKVDYHKTTEIIRAAYFNLWDIAYEEELEKK